MAKGANGRSSIYRDANGSWHGYISMPAGPDGRVRRRHVRGPTKAAVAAKVRKLEDQRAGGLVSGPAVTVSQWVRSWMALQEFAVRPNTLKGYRTDQRWIDRGCGHVRLERIGPGHIEAIWRVMLNAGLTSGSIVHCKRTLNAALNTAVGRGMLDRNPIRLATTPRWEPPEVTPFTADEARRVLDAARELRNSARWSVALALGLRQGEALGLRWDDVDLDIGTLKVRRQLQRRQWRHGCAARDQSPTCGTRAASCPARTGGGQELTDVKSTAGRRTLRLPAPLTTLLRQHQAVQAVERLAAGADWQDWGLVFAQVDGKPIDQKRDWLAWKALLVAAEVADARLHDARHTAATLLLVQGVPEIVAMEILGHTDLRVTRRYQHVADELLQDAADRIGAALWSP
jgi:integrase